MALLNPKILHYINEGLKGNFIEQDDEDPDTCGWWPTEEPNHWYFEALMGNLIVGAIHWYGKGNPESNVMFDDGEEFYDVRNVIDMEVRGDSLIVTDVGGTKTVIR